MGGAYRERQNEQCIKDVKALYKWLNSEIDDPFENYHSMVLKEPGYSDERVLLMQDETHEVQNAIRKALLQYVLSQEPNDFIYKELSLTACKVGAQVKYDFDGVSQIVTLNDHHIFPVKNATKIGQSSKEIRGDKSNILNSPLNRTYISAVSNAKISDMKPEDYFKYVSDIALIKHCISADSIQHYKDATSEKKAYENALQSRFEELKKTLILELDKLKA